MFSRSLALSFCASITCVTAVHSGSLDLTAKGQIVFQTDAGVSVTTDFTPISVASGPWITPTPDTEAVPASGNAVKVESKGTFRDTNSSATWSREATLSGDTVSFTERWSAEPVRGFAGVSLTDDLSNMQDIVLEFPDSTTKQVSFAELLAKKEQFFKANGTSMVARHWNGATVTVETGDIREFMVTIWYDPARNPTRMTVRIHDGQPAELGDGEMQWKLSVR